MDEYDERLVDWFDYDFWPMLGGEHGFALRMARESRGRSPYWEGYLAALDMVCGLVDRGIERIRDEVLETEVGDDD